VTTYSQACTDPQLFGPWFAGESWSTWRVLDKALFGEPLTPDELKIFTELTGRNEAPSAPAKEAWLVMGRRSGKDIKAASIAVYMATIGAELHGYRKRLQRGERGVVQILAVDRDQASVAFRYAKAFFEQPLLAPLLKRETADTLELTNDLAVEITTNDQRRVRGRTVVAAIFDEVAHWRSENTSSPDLEVYRAVKPAMLTMPNAMLIGISSPYASRGLLWEKFNKNYGQDGDVLVAKAQRRI
jgi:phage terminase large subunit-like protein